MKNNISEEKKQENREKNKLAAQRRRANLSEDQKREAREKNKLAMQVRRANLSGEERLLSNQRLKQSRANLSDEERSLSNQRLKQRRASLSDEERSLLRAQDATQHRRKYQEDKRVNNQLPQTIQSDNNTDDNKGYDSYVIEDESEIEGEDENKRVLAVNPLTDWKLYREKRNAQNRISHKARYAKLKEAEVQLKELTKGNTNSTICDNDLRQLQLLANRRQQMLENNRNYQRLYAQMHPNQHRRWIAIQQTWDEDNPCR